MLKCFLFMCIVLALFVPAWRLMNKIWGKIENEIEKGENQE